MAYDIPSQRLAAAGAQEDKSGASTPPSLFESRQLFGTGKEIVIRHGGELYRLRVTRQNKLILTK